MGLDMYLEKYPKVGVEVKTILAVESFARWIKSDKKCSFEDWCGYTTDDLPEVNTLVSLLEMLETKYYVWDDEKKFPQEHIYEQVGYWRKANAIHKWFVENVQDDIDDCDYHRPVTKEDLETLFDMCREVLADHSKAGKLLPSQSGFSLEVSSMMNGILRTLNIQLICVRV